MERLKVMTVVGTRPEIIRLSECIRACDRHFRHVLVHTGQNWDHGLSRVFFEDLSLRAPDYQLQVAGESLGDTMGNIIARTYRIMEKERPDALLILGDTNSALCAIPAKRLKIPIFHMEAGNRCFDEKVPEEINRRIVDHIADIHLPYTEHSRRYLLAEGIRGDRIFVTGSPMAEVLLSNREKIQQSTILDRLDLSPGGYMLISAHREENIDDEGSFHSLMEALNTLARTYEMPVLYSVHPRSARRIAERGFVFHPLVRPHEPFGFLDYNHLQLNSWCVLSDSGTLSEESAMLGFPAVLIRTSTERPEVLDAGRMVLGGIRARDILPAVAMARSLWDRGEPASLPVDYRDVNVSAKVIRLIESYTKIINSAVWRKDSP